LQAVQLIAERADQLQEEVSQLQAFIRKDERPQLGDEALKKSAAQQTPRPKAPEAKPAPGAQKPQKKR
jgi:hypothetical protein